MKRTTTITLAEEINLPRPPNFLTTTDGRTVPVAAFTEEALRQLGAAWTEALVERAREQRATPADLDAAYRAAGARP